MYERLEESKNLSRDIKLHRHNANIQGIWLFVATIGLYGMDKYPDMRIFAIVILLVMFFYILPSGTKTFVERDTDLKPSKNSLKYKINNIKQIKKERLYTQFVNKIIEICKMIIEGLPFFSSLIFLFFSCICWYS